MKPVFFADGPNNNTPQHCGLVCLGDYTTMTRHKLVIGRKPTTSAGGWTVGGVVAVLWVNGIHQIV